RTDPAAMKGVEDQLFRTGRQANKKMAGEGEAIGFPTLRAARMHIENSERHRQAFPAVDNPHQIGVLQVVIALVVAGIPMFQENDLVERADPLADTARRPRMAADIAREHPQMLAVPFRSDPRALERGERQGRLGDRQNALARGAKLAQKTRASLRIVALRWAIHLALISKFLDLDSSRRRGGR